MIVTDEQFVELMAQRLERLQWADRVALMAKLFGVKYVDALLYLGRRLQDIREEGAAVK